MESRRVVLLTEGYLRGWLNFEYKTSLSKLREDYILSAIERRSILDFSAAKVGAMGAVIGANPTRPNLNILSRELRDYFELTLPYTREKSKISSNIDRATLNDPAFWRKYLAQAQEELAKHPPKEDAEIIPVEPAQYE